MKNAIPHNKEEEEEEEESLWRGWIDDLPTTHESVLLHILHDQVV